MTSVKKRKVPPPTREEFYCGLLLSIRVWCGTFISDGARFHEAFEAALGAVTTDHKRFIPIIRDLFEDKDPVFGVYRGASAMVFWGLNAAILTLDAPTYSVARFSISASSAVKELECIKDADVYRMMAKAFCAALR
jgi:hypothetical protein